MDVGQEQASFDGIICIGGEDWWYHNRGHFDFQVMRRLARRWPVLFVNSIGVRMPSAQDKRVFLARLGRKLASYSRGLVEVEPGFHVFSPVSIPGKAALEFSRRTLAPQIRRAARRAGIHKPLVWVHCPAGAGLEQELDPALVVLQRTDRFESFPEGDHDLLSAQIDYLKDRADLVIYASQHLYGEERKTVRRAALVTHGVDVERFVEADQDESCIPDDVAAIGGPRVGFIGGIDAHTFDPDLFLATVDRLPDLSFVMVGGSSLPKGWCQAQNVHFLGRKPYEDIARYMAAMDVLIMPWNQSQWIEACNPIKLKEYLAVGRPVVTTDFAALGGWRRFVKVAGDPDSFAAAIAEAIEQPHDPWTARHLLSTESWDRKAGDIANLLVQVASEAQARSSEEFEAA